MKSTRTEGVPFSLVDFEEGLMLAGYLPPSSVSDMAKREQLAEYEKQLKSRKGGLYFKRAVLAAEIANQLHQEPTFGRVKFQKLVYMCEHMASMGLEDRYSKLVAGPFDNKFMHSIEKEFVKQKWFTVEKIKDGNIHRSVYKPLANSEKYKTYFRFYFLAEQQQVEYVISLFRTEKTDTCEVAATLLACYLERSHKDSTDDIFNKFYSWSEAKKRFQPEMVRRVWHWMISKGLIAQ